MPFLDDSSPEPTPSPTEALALDAFHQLVQDLSDALGPSSGLDSDDVDPMDIQRLMEGYVSRYDEWVRYAFADHSRAYTRNLVDEGNGESNLLVLVWTPGRSSPIHDHANSHCVMKILKGCLRETLYAWPDQDKLASGDQSPMEVTRDRVYGENEVTYMSDKLGLHKIANPDPNGYAVSLHLYTPPNAAHFGCSVFEERTGRSRHVKQCSFFSRRGQKL